MDHIGRMFRPPSEARSLLLQVTLGCSHNSCAYCGMYRDKTFKPKPWAQVEADLIETAARASTGGPKHRRVFLCDGDALVLGTRRLMQILEGIREHLPWVRRVGTYGDTRSVAHKSVDELRELRDAGLSIVYHGMESGDDDVLRMIDKGSLRADVISLADKLREADIMHFVIGMLGIGGVALSEAHARNTASLLTRADPLFVGLLTTTVVPGTPLHAMQQRGEFVLPDKFRMLEELRTIVDLADFSGCNFSCNHASNYLLLRGSLPDEREDLLAQIDRVLTARDDRMLVPEHQRGL